MSGNIALTSTQTAIWLDQAQQPKKPIYNTGEQIRLTERLDSACFSAAVDHVVSETEALRLVFRSTGGPISAAIVPPNAAASLRGQATALLAIVDTPARPIAGRSTSTHPIIQARTAARHDWSIPAGHRAMTLFKAAESWPDEPPDYRWSSFVSEVQIVELAGGHADFGDWHHLPGLARAFHAGVEGYLGPHQAGVPAFTPESGIDRPPRPSTLMGFIDVDGERRVDGWAHDPDDPDASVLLDLIVDGKKIAQIVANLDRPDLASALGSRTGHAFSAPLPIPLTSRQRLSVEVRRAADGVALPRSEHCLAADLRLRWSNAGAG